MDWRAPGWRGGLTGCLLLAALISGWSAWREHEKAPAAAPPEMRSDYVLHEFTLVALDSEGLESFSVAAPLLQQSIGARTLELETPLFTLPDRDRREHPRWRLAAVHGLVSADGKRIRLTGDVEATPFDRNNPMRIQTQALDLFPQQELATSDALITITRPGTTMTGTGMRAQLDANRVELLSKVNVRNEPLSP